MQELCFYWCSTCTITCKFSDRNEQVRCRCIRRSASRNPPCYGALLVLTLVPLYLGAELNAVFVREFGRTKPKNFEKIMDWPPAEPSKAILRVCSYRISSFISKRRISTRVAQMECVTKKLTSHCQNYACKHYRLSLIACLTTLVSLICHSVDGPNNENTNFECDKQCVALMALCIWAKTPIANKLSNTVHQH